MINPADSKLHENAIVPEKFTPENTAAIYTVIGKITTGWGLLEFAMDSVAIVIYHKIGGREVEPELPIQTERKIRFIRSCFKRIDALSPFAKEAVDLLDQIKPLVQARNDITHGFLSDFNEREAHLTFVRIKLNKDKNLHSEVRVKFEFTDLVQKSIAIHDVAHRFAQIAARLLTQFEIKQERGITL